MAIPATLAQERQQLFRTCQLLKEVFLVYREQTFDPTWLTAAKSDTHLFLYSMKLPADRAPRPYALVRPPGWTDREHAAFLTHNICGTPITCFAPMIKELLQGVYDGANMGETAAQLHAEKQYISDGAYCRDASTGTWGFARRALLSHRYIIIKLSDQTEYVIDLAGAQFNQHKPVLERNEYEMEFVEVLISETEFGVGHELHERSLRTMTFEDKHDYCLAATELLVRREVGRDKEEIMENVRLLDEVGWDRFVVEYRARLGRRIDDWLLRWGGFEGLMRSYPDLNGEL